MKDENTFDESPFDNVPDLEIYRANLNKLKAIDLSNFSQAEIHKIVHDHTVFIPSYVCPIPSNEFAEYKLYRARFKVDPEKENVYLRSTFSYPHNVFCDKNGRANIKRRNVFYCSDHPIAAILESKPNDGDSGCLSIWATKIDRSVHCALFLQEDLKESNRWSNDAKDLHNYLRSITPKFKEGKEAQLNLLNEFISSLFIEEGAPYSITSWLSNGLLYSQRGIDMLLYPSVITNSYFSNIAIHPNFVDNYLQLEKVFQFTINKIANKKLDYSIGLIGVPGLMNIDWRQPSDQELKDIVNLLNGHQQ